MEENEEARGGGGGGREMNAEEGESSKKEVNEEEQNKNAEEGDESQKPKDDLKLKQTMDDHSDDPRLRLMDKEWFKDKDCAVLGCNTGKLTIQIAQEFGCRTILGVDNNSELVKEANKNLAEVVESKSLCEKIQSPSSSSSDEDIPLEIFLRGPGSTSSSFTERNLSDVVSFKQLRFDRITPPFAQRYHTIVCLSETYWTDLDLKADAIVPAIQEICYNLRKDAHFVLEPKSLKPYGSEFYDAEEETRAKRLDPDKIVRDQQFIRIFNERFWRRFVDEVPEYSWLEQINFKGECIVVFRKYPNSD